MERAKTDVGVFINKLGLGLIKSSVPEVTFKVKRQNTKRRRTINKQHLYFLQILNT